METMEVYAYIYNKTYYCFDCLCELLGYDLLPVAYASQQIDSLINQGKVETINDTTVQYEQWSGELIPLKGIFCTGCDAELYAPMETEGE